MSTDQWLEVTVSVAAAQVADCESALQNLGAVAVTLADAQDQAILEPGVNETPLWADVIVTGLYDAVVDPLVIRAALASGNFPVDRFAHRMVADQDWTRSWMRDSSPTQFGDRLWIVPSHCAVPDGALVPVVLDPGLAFGTGTHPTTALCLEFLDQIQLAEKTVLDFGCGSGVLAIAALKLGAKQALCVDNDPQAIAATQENAKRNGVLERIEITTADALVPGAAEVIVANILANPLIDLAPILSAAARPDAALGLSGILLDQGRSVRRAYQSQFDAFEIWQRQDWLLIKAQKT